MKSSTIKNCENCNWFREFFKEPLIVDGHRVDCCCAYREIFIDRECYCAHWEECGEDYYFYRDHMIDIIEEMHRRYTAATTTKNSDLE